jgi:hypothetical protein
VETKLNTVNMTAWVHKECNGIEEEAITKLQEASSTSCVVSSLCCAAHTCAGDATIRPRLCNEKHIITHQEIIYVVRTWCSCPTSCRPPRGLPERVDSTHQQLHLGQHDTYRVFPATRMRRMQAPHLWPGKHAYKWVHAGRVQAGILG